MKIYWNKDAFSTRIPQLALLETRELAAAMRQRCAGVAKLVDAPDLGSGAARRGGSSPSTRTTLSSDIGY